MMSIALKGLKDGFFRTFSAGIGYRVFQTLHVWLLSSGRFAAKIGLCRHPLLQSVRALKVLAWFKAVEDRGEFAADAHVVDAADIVGQ